MPALRVLHLMSCRGWSSDAYWAGRIAVELGRRGHRVTFVARAGTEARVLGRLRGLGLADVQTLTFRGRRAPRSTVADVDAIRRLALEHDVVHVHRGKEHWLAAAAIGLARRPVPVVRTRHIVAPVRAHALNRWLYRRTALVLAVSQSIRQQYIASGLMPAGRVRAVLGGVDHRHFDGSRIERGPGPPVVGVLAGLRAMKGHTVLLEAAQMLRGAGHTIQFLLVGEGPERPHIARRILELGLGDTVTLAGFSSTPEVTLRGFHVALYPSLASEGMGRVLFEYMAMARPIVASAIGLAPEILTHGASALLVPPGHAEALARAVLEMLGSPDDADRMGRAARRLVEERYSGAAVAAAVEASYLQALEASGVTAR